MEVKLMEVPLLDLKAQYNTIKDEINNAMLQVVESQDFILGSEVKKLEESMCNYLKCKHSIGVSSGTDALLVALMAIDLKPNDEVIVPTYSFFATAGVVSRLNAKPVFIDINPTTFNIDPDKIEKKITPKTRAIIVVHLYGQSADMDPIVNIAKENNLIVIEDAAQAIGVQYKDGKRVGTIGHIGCFSFFPSKNLGCFGDGGLVTTNNEELAEKIKILRVHGSKPKYYHKLVGGNFRLDSIQAAVLNVKFPYLDSWSEARRNNANEYLQLFKEMGLSEVEGKLKFDKKNEILLPKAVYKESNITNYHIYNQFVMKVKKRDELKKYLSSKGIGTEIYYPVPFHRQECFKHLNSSDIDYPYSNEASEKSLALPIYPELTKEQLSYVVETIRDFVYMNRS
jgi:dTDP-4-amino-4,6-dideoxygalactose transaminase